MIRRKTLVLFFLACSWFIAGSQSGADSVYRIDARIQSHDLSPYTAILSDSTGTITAAQLLEGTFAGEFQPLSEYGKGFLPHWNYWLRVPMHSNAAIEHWWLIVKIKDPRYEYYFRWDEMEAILADGHKNMISHQRSGVNTPRSEKQLKQPAGIVGADISLPPEETRFLYIRLSNVLMGYIDATPVLELRNPEIGIPRNKFAILLYVLSAIAFMISALSFFFFLFIKEKAYLFFFIYLTFLSLHYLVLHPELPFTDWFIPEHPQWTMYFFSVFTAGGFIVFMLFGRYFINLPALSKKTDRLLMIFLGIWAIVLLAELIYMASFNEMIPFRPAQVGVIIAIAFIIRFAFFKTILARFFVAGAGWLLLFTVLGMFGKGRIEELGLNPWPVGQIGQMLIYMAGLAYKIRLNERAKAEAEHIKDMDAIKSRFFANISHEFRTPLTLIRGVLQQIEDQSSKREERNAIPERQIKSMRRNTDRLLELVNQLLDLSRLDSGRMKLQVVKGDVLQVLKALSHAFDSMAERKQIHYHIHFPEHTRIAFFDKDKLEKIFTNLLSNAFKYTPEKGTVSVTVETHDNRLRITVGDSGPGIPKKELDKVFDRFYQIEGTEDKGSGIGLALVKELVDLYNGQISVSSEPGTGSEFRVSLPMDKRDFHEDDLVYGEWQGEESVSPTSFDEPEQLVSRQAVRPDLPLLLVIEDNQDLRQFILESVETRYNVIEATNGIEGYEKAVSEIPDLIISDVMMPRMDGFTLTNELKKDERTSHIPVILLTAKADQTHKLEGLETGADDYLTKPFDVPELLMRVHNLIAQRKLLRKKFAGQIQLKPSEVAATSLEENFLVRVMNAIEKHMEREEFGVEELAREVTMSRSQLHRKLDALIDKSPSELLRQTRLLRAKELLLKKAGTPSEVAFKVGFNSHTYFSKCFKEEFGMSPSEV